ncbi:MbcA/ParS/Xre antitoxin family protein [Vibrio cholerae]
MNKKRSRKTELVKGDVSIAQQFNKSETSNKHALSLEESVAVEAMYREFPILKSEIEDVFGTVTIGSEWLISKIPALGRVTPLEAIQRGDLKLVLDTLNKMKFGEYS